jgi:RNA polymerase sigma-70 factor, ECF subfamily
MACFVDPSVGRIAASLLLLASAIPRVNVGCAQKTVQGGMRDDTAMDRSMPIRSMSRRTPHARARAEAALSRSPAGRPPRVMAGSAAAASRPGVTRDSTHFLVLRAQRGDKRCFSLLWDLYSPVVNAILLTMVQQSDADDLTQDVALVALRALPKLKEPARLPSWLCAIARNMGRNALQAQRKSRSCSLSEVGDVEAPRRDGSFDANEVIARIRSLPPCHREPLMLRLVLGMSGPEIAARTGMTEGSVRVNLCRGMKVLRRRLGNLLE